MSEIYYQDTIRLTTVIDNAKKYISVDVAAAESGGTCWLTLVDTPTADCNFLLREWNYDNTSRLEFSGNDRADTPDAHGNFRLIHVGQPTGSVGDTYCVSMGAYQPNENLAYWGVSWDRAYDLETFTLFAVNWPSSDGGVCSGDPVKIRSMIGAKNPAPVGSIGQFLTLGGVDGGWRIIGSVHTYGEGAEFVIEKVEVA